MGRRLKSSAAAGAKGCGVECAIQRHSNRQRYMVISCGNIVCGKGVGPQVTRYLLRVLEERSLTTIHIVYLPGIFFQHVFQGISGEDTWPGSPGNNFASKIIPHTNNLDKLQ
jgi:hypothetical protein